MTPKRKLLREMWTIFACQLVLAICMTVSMAMPAFLVLRAAEQTNQMVTTLLPFIAVHLQGQQDPNKLRLETLGLLDETADDANFREQCYRFLFEMSFVIGAVLVVLSLGTGFCAYRLHRQIRNEDSTPK